MTQSSATSKARPNVRGAIREFVSMAGMTAWGVGGCARRVFEPADVDDLSQFLHGVAADEPLLFVGLGSNLLVRDGGFPGTVILTTKGFGDLVLNDDRTVTLGAGVACPKAARFCADQGLAGAEFFAGIPGTIGGALAMNAGAYGAETWNFVERVETVDRTGKVIELLPSSFQVSYRTVIGPEGLWFVRATLRLEDGDPNTLRNAIRNLLRRRIEDQPTGQRSCGSVFRNPQGDFAGRLIEATGLKGLTVGDASVSDKHANFIINEGGASADDIEQLIHNVAREVELATGIRLHPEVRIVGKPRCDESESS